MKTHYFKLISELFPYIPAITYALTLSSELACYNSVLDIGCGTASPIRFFTFQRSVGLDAYGPALNEARKRKTHTKYVKAASGRILRLFKKEFDAVVALDLIEHLDKNDGYQLINDMKKLAKKKVIIFTPNGFLPQYAKKNKYQIHKSGWTTDDFTRKGFHVKGMLGPKFLRSGGHGITKKPFIFWALFSEIAQFTYIKTRPEKAAALLAVYEHDRR